MEPILVIDQLKKIVALGDYVNQCPRSCRAAVINAALENSKYGLRDQQPRAEIKLRWLAFNLKVEQEKPLHRKYKYIESVTKCERLFEADDLQQLKDAIREKKQLPVLRQQQEELIFNECLLRATAEYLTNYTNEDKTFSAEDILAQATKLYKQRMYREALYQFEVLCLIERYDFLMNKKESDQRSLVDNFMTISYEIDPEIQFIKTKLASDNLLNFKLHGTDELACHLDDLSQLSLKNLKDKLDEFMQSHATNNIDPDVLKQTGEFKNNQIKLRKISLYFDNKDLSKIVDHMSQAISTVEQFSQHLQLPPPTKHYAVVATKDKALIALREAVDIYKKNLTEIENNEHKTFANRDPNLLNRRKQALATLETCMNQDDTLTTQMKAVTIACITEIKANKPAWVELSLLDKILDIISLGLHALVRFNTFKEHTAAINLQKNIEDNDITPTLDG